MESVRGVVQEAYHEGGPQIQGAPEGTSSLQGVQGEDGGGILGKSYDESAWAGGRGATELENPGHGGRTTDFSNGFPIQGRPAELSGGGMTGPSVKEDGNEGSLPTPACPQHRGHSGGGNPPPTTVHLMRHADPPAGAEQKAPGHRVVR